MSVIIDSSDMSKKRIIRKVYKKVLAHFSQRNIFDVYVSFFDLEGIRELNARTRNVDAPTDVLSFPSLAEPKPPLTKADFEYGQRVLGEIAICMVRVREQAAEFGHSEERELGYLFAHGMLHLLGFDHVEDDTEMRAHADAIMRLAKLEV